MKLTFENHPEFNRLINYFKKIEALAENMGIDVDDLVNDHRHKRSSMYTSFKKNVLAMAQKRADTLKRRNDGSSSEEAPLVGLTIHFNKPEGTQV